MSSRNAFYAQSGGVSAVINASACGVLQTARHYSDHITKVFAGRNGIIGALTEDLIDTTSGGNVPHVKIPLKPGYQVEFAERIKAETGILTGAVGLITNAQQADMILEKEQADIILIARESLRDPNFPLHAAQTLEDDIVWPVQYERAKPRK